ncbi:hypothetical protein KAX02_05635 [candidate division WOR-3 bacterium]|nr:hypothetical protein [candidate division WOR-3 bacterium]
MPTGIRSHVGLKKETTWGNAVTVDKFLPFTKESITPDIENVQSESLRGLKDKPPSYQGEKKFGGNIIFEVHPANIGHILRSALGAPAAAVASGTAIVELEDCEDAWVGDGGVISGIDSGNYKKGSASVKLQVTADVAADDILASEAVSSTDMHSDTHIKFWIKSSVACDAGDLVVRVSENAAGASTPEAYEDMNVPLLSAGVWTECTVAIATAADLLAVISVAIIMHVDKGECTIWLDDLRRVVTSDASNTKDHVFTPVQTDFSTLCNLPPYTFEVYRDQSNDKAWQYKGGIVDTLTLSFGTGDKILKATAGILAKEEAEIDKESVSLETTNPFVWNQAQVKIATNDHDYLEDFTLNLKNNTLRKFSLNQSAYARAFYSNDYRIFDFSFTTDFVDKTEYDKFMLGTQQAFQIVFTGASCEDGYYYKLQIDIPAMKYTAYPINVEGPGRLSVKVVGEADYSSSDGYAVKITLTNLETSY